MVPKETVDKATEKTAEARLEERGGGLGRGYLAERGERSSRGNRED